MISRVESILRAIFRELVLIKSRQDALRYEVNRMRHELFEMRNIVATEAEALNALSVKVDDLIADVRAALAVISGPDNKLGPDGQAALDTLSAKVDAFDAELSATPPPEPTP